MVSERALLLTSNRELTQLLRNAMSFLPLQFDIEEKWNESFRLRKYRFIIHDLLSETAIPIPDPPFTAIALLPDKAYDDHLRLIQSGYYDCVFFDGKDERGLFLQFGKVFQQFKLSRDLQGTRDALHKLTQRIPDLAFSFDTTFAITFASPSAEEVTGYSSEELTGLPLSQLILEKDQPHVFRKLKNDLEQARKQSRSLLFRYNHKTEGIRRGEMRCSLTPTSEGGVRFDGLLRDRTDSWQAHSLLNTVIESSPVPSIVTRARDGLILFVNHPMEELLGTPAHGIIHQHSRDFYADPSYKDQLTDALSAHGRIQNFEMQLRRPDNSTLWVILNVESSIIDEDQVLVAAMQNIDERKKMELELFESREMFRRLTESMDEAFWIVSADLKELLYTNHRYNKIIQRDYEKLPRDPRSLAQLVHPDDREAVFSALSENTKLPLTQEFRILRPSGEIRWVRETAYPIYNKDGSLMQICGLTQDITDQKRAEERLKLFHKIFMTTSDGIVISDSNRRIIATNPAAKRFAQTEGAVVGTPIESLPQQDQFEEIKKQIEEKQIYNGEIETTDKGGNKRYTDLSIFPIYNEDQTLVYFVGQGKDITEKRHRQEQQEQRLRYEKGIAACSQLLLEADSESPEEVLPEALRHLVEAADVGRIYVFRNVMDETLGLCMDQQFEVCADGTSPDIDDKRLKLLPYSNAFAEWRTALAENRHLALTSDEMPVPIEAMLHDHHVETFLILPIWIGKAWYGFIGFDDVEKKREWTPEEIRLLRNASEIIGSYLQRRQAFEALQYSEERFRGLVENANDIIFSTDNEGHFNYISPQLVDFTGYAPEDFVHKPLNTIIHPDDSPEALFHSLLGNTNATKHAGFEVRIRHQSGEWRWFVTNFSLIRNQEGDVQEIIGIAHDITRIKQILSDLAEANRNLQATQTQLIQSEKMASLGTMVAGIAHEINTPIGAVMSMHNTQVRAFERMRSALDTLCVGESLDHKTLRTMVKIIDDANDVIKNGTDRVATIVKKLRSFARLDESDLKNSDLHAGIEDTLTLIHHEIKHTITIVRDFGDLPMIFCYPGRLNQVFLNLLNNARQAIPGKGTITIRTYRSNDEAVIEFIDSGVGIPEEKRKRIFDPGFTTKGVGIGVGLGLSICYQIMEKHHGSIEVESQEGVGSTFRLRIPLNLQELLEDDAKEKDDHSPGSAG